MNLSTTCGVCGDVAAHIEVLAPDEQPGGGAWWLRYAGIEAGNGRGDEIDATRAEVFIEVLTPPIDLDRLDELDLYDDAGVCRECGTAYCHAHWASVIGYGTCPNGHGKSLDPHWSPD